MFEDGFELFITVDRNLPDQHKFANLKIPIIVLYSINNRRDTLRLLIPKVLEYISKGFSLSIIEIF
jgi:hypothetical protein